jgi:spore germination protein GerM
MKLRNTVLISLIIAIIFLLIAIFIYYKQNTSPTQIEPSQSGDARRQSELYLDTSTNFTTVALFFASWGGDYLLPEKRKIFYTTSVTDQAKQAIIELINGPKQSYLFSPISTNTTLRELYIAADGTAYVDLSREFIDNHWGGSEGEILSIYSIINTLTINFPSIQRVKILVEGKEIDSIAGHISLRYAFKTDFSLIGRR